MSTLKFGNMQLYDQKKIITISINGEKYCKLILKLLFQLYPFILQILIIFNLYTLLSMEKINI